MKKLALFLTILAGFLFNADAQTKKDGTPDMRYNSNKQIFTGPSYPTSSDVRIQSGYVRDNGTYVQPHFKTNNNATNLDNLSTSGNYNIYNNTTGSRAGDYTPAASYYGNGKTIQTGINGGQYYINNNGNKVYVPKSSF